MEHVESWTWTDCFHFCFLNQSGMGLCLLSIVYGAVGSSIESLPDGTRNGTVTFGGHEHMGASGVALVWMNQAGNYQVLGVSVLQLVNMVNHPVYS